MIQQLTRRYGPVTQALHWITAVVVLTAFIYGPGGSEQHVYASARDFDRQLHETLGICVLVLVALRLLWRLVDVRPEHDLPRLMRVAATLAHVALYLLLFAVPLTAIAGAWLEGHPLTLLTGIEIPPMFTASHNTGALFANIHTWLADAIMWIAGLHALAGIYHYLILRDGVLVSMLPRWSGVRELPGVRKT
ncbi:MAG: cytochrome b/b6 domain-containing protein [Casimicrobiaceae bacterium]